MPNITFVLTEQQVNTLQELIKLQGLNRSDTIRLALKKIANESGLVWPDDMPQHGDFSRARNKRWPEREESPNNE